MRNVREVPMISGRQVKEMGMRIGLIVLLMAMLATGLGSKISCGGSDGNGNGGDNIIIDDGSSGPTRAPSAPSGLTAQAISSSQINIAWTDNSDNEQGFKIERRTGTSGSYLWIDTAEPNVTSYSSMGLLANTAYYYRIRAYNNKGESAWSNEATATTSASSVILPDPVTTPSPAVSATNVSITAQLSWATASGATSYDVYFGTTKPPAYKTNTTATTYIPTLTYYTTYYWRIDSKNADGITTGNLWMFTTETQPVTVPSAPSSLAATVVSSTQINLTWADNSDNESGFIVQRKTGSSSANVDYFDYLDANITSYQNTGLTDATVYYYTIVAYNSTGNSVSNEVSATTQSNALSLGEAVDNIAMTWTTGGDANWTGQTTTAYYGGDAAQSGDINNSQSSWLQTTVTGPGTLSFYWKVSSEPNFDFLRFYIDDVEQTGAISGEVAWAQKTYSITSGSHTLKWAYTKDYSVSTGSDAGWLDKVEFTAAPTTKWKVAVYGETGGFDLTRHTDEFEVKVNIPCWNGSTFDSSVSQFTADDVDVIFIGGDTTFSSATALQIENAVYNSGKILVINFWSDDRFSASLPGSYVSYAAYGPGIVAGDTSNPIVQQILSGCPTNYSRTGTDYNRGKYSPKSGATVITKFTSDNSPAMMVWNYGRGKVIHQPLELMGAFYGDYTDTIIYQAVKWALSISGSSSPAAGWSKFGYDLGGTNHFPFAASRAPTALGLKWSKTTPGNAARTGDVNGDGQVEVVIASGTTLSVYNATTGSLICSWTVPLSNGSTGMLLEDATGDNIADILIGYRDASNNLKIGVYDVTTQQLVKTLSRGASGYDSSWEPRAIKGDKVLAICGAGYSLAPRGLSILSLASGAQTLYYGTGSAQMNSTIGDLNNDGKLDIVFSWFTPHNGAGWWGGGDYNGTDDDNLWAVCVDETGAEIFKNRIDTYGGQLDGSWASMIADLDNDGTQEVIGFEQHDSTYYNGTDRIYKLSPTGAKLASYTGPYNGNGWCSYHACADINNDGKQEIVASEDDGKIYILDYNLLLLSSSAAGAGKVLVLNDFNGDGTKDIIVYQPSASKIRVLKTDFTELYSYTITGDFWSAIVSDIGNDGINEIIVSTSTGVFILGE